MKLVLTWLITSKALPRAMIPGVVLSKLNAKAISLVAAC